MSGFLAAVVFGWPGPILAIALAAIGARRGKAGWFAAAAILIAPFSFYLGLNPKTPLGFFLPLIPVLGAIAASRSAHRLAWLSVLILVAVLGGIAGAVVYAHMRSPRG
jgi:hypothetical protein